jgi:hypothetical protein
LLQYHTTRCNDLETQPFLTFYTDAESDKLYKVTTQLSQLGKMVVMITNFDGFFK